MRTIATGYLVTQGNEPRLVRQLAGVASRASICAAARKVEMNPRQGPYACSTLHRCGKYTRPNLLSSMCPDL
jgi:hypothetical protein